MPTRRPPSRHTRRRRLQATMPATPKQQEKWWQAYRRIPVIVRLIIGTPLAAVMFVLGVWGPPWPMKPVFAPIAPALGSASDAPFSVTNKSAWFFFYNLIITCKLMNFRAIGPTGASIVQQPGAVAIFAPRGANAVLPPLVTDTFVCPIGRAFMVDRRNAGEQLASASLFFVAEYDRQLWWGRTQTTSITFTFAPTASPPQWLPGEPLK